MKTLEDAVWQIMEKPAGVVAKIKLEHEIEISIAMNQSTYGGRSGLFEICVFEKDDYAGMKLNCLSGETVDGWLTLADVNKKIQEIQKELEERANVKPSH